MKCEIIAVGSELLTPFRQDTNSLFLTEKLNEIGVAVAFKTIVGDRRRDLVHAVRAALGRVDLIAVMGGLGPTEDDLSREAVAEALGLAVRRDGQLVAALAARFAQRRILMTDNNLKQQTYWKALRCCRMPTAPRRAMAGYTIWRPSQAGDAGSRASE